MTKKVSVDDLSLLEGFEEVSENSPEELPEDNTPAQTSANWSDYVISHFVADELYEGHPKTEGLRRVAELLIGPIIKSVPRTIDTPNNNNQFRATVEFNITFMKEHQGGYYEVEFGDVADVFSGNTDAEYARHACATAATRAEGRALRKALKLKNVVAAEELTNVSIEDAGLTDNIVSVQIKGIDNFCKRLDIDVIRFINSGKQKYNSIEQVSNTTAKSMIKKLNEYQQNVKLIPDSIKYYDKEWNK